MVARPVGSLGPSRARILAKIRDQPSLYALLDDGVRRPGGQGRKRCRAEVVELERRDSGELEPSDHVVGLAS